MSVSTQQPTSTSLTDLPPELLDQITAYLPTANSISRLAQTSKSLHAYVEKDAWTTFNRSCFASLIPHTSDGGARSSRELARTLTTLSRNLDRRGFVASYVEPGGGDSGGGGGGGRGGGGGDGLGGFVRAFPGSGRRERWRRPRGQTVGFVPVLSAYEEGAGGGGKEVLGFSAGAGFVVRVREEAGEGLAEGSGKAVDGRGKGARRRRGSVEYEEPGTRWLTYRPHSAVEGMDDVTALHLLKEPSRMPSQDQDFEGEFVVMGTAHGDLQLIHLPSGDHGAGDVESYFTTQGRSIRSTSLLQPEYENPTLAAALGDSTVALYFVDSNQPKVAPSSEIEVLPTTTANSTTNGIRSSKSNPRIWSTTYLSSQHLALGVGPSQEPIQIHTILPTGLSPKPTRRYSFTNRPDALDDRSDEIAPNGTLPRPTSSVYPITPLAPTNTASTGSTSIFLSGGYDGVVRLHDLRSDRNCEQKYIDPVDDAPVYSLLPYGRETLLAGSSRHSILKLFDLRLGAKAYSYLDASPKAPNSSPERKVDDWNFFLRPQSASYPGRGGGNNWARRSAESSIYSLAAPGGGSPHLYAGLENAVVELAWTGVCDKLPDPAVRGLNRLRSGRGVIDLAGYKHGVEMKLLVQRGVRDTLDNVGREKTLNGLVGKIDSGSGGLERREGLADFDERWRVGT